MPTLARRAFPDNLRKETCIIGRAFTTEKLMARQASTLASQPFVHGSVLPSTRWSSSPISRSVPSNCTPRGYKRFRISIAAVEGDGAEPTM